MKLSEAILKGCELRPEKSEALFFQGEKAACVMGAAWLGLGHHVGTVNIPCELRLRFPELIQESPLRGVGGPFAYFGNPPLLWQALIFLNDMTNMSREHIASKLEEVGL